MHRFAITQNFLYLQIFCLNLVVVLAQNKDVIEFSVPAKCKPNEYFDTIAFSCFECDADKNLEPSADRFGCVCNKFSRMSDFKNGHPVCIFCGPNATVTVDGKDCVSCKNTVCECPLDKIQIDRDVNGTLLDFMYCYPCPEDTFPSSDRSRCLPCDNFIYSRHTNCTCPLLSHVRVQNYCLHKDDLSDWLDVRTTYLINFESGSIDSYYFRSELQAAMYFCKKKNRLACEHLSNMCALTLYVNGVPCMLFMQMHISPIWLFYNKDEIMSTLNSKQITEVYSLAKDAKNSTLNFTVATFTLEGSLQSFGMPDMPCNLIKNIRFGVNFKTQCKMTVKELLNAKMNFISPYITFVEKEKVLMHALPVLIKNTNDKIEEESHWQLVRKFFLVDNISGFKTVPDLMSGKFKKAGNLSVLRYMNFLNILVKVQSGNDRGKIFPPLFVVEYAELENGDIINNTEVILDFKVTFVLKDNDIDYNLQIIIGVLSGVALIFSGIKTWSYCKRNYTSVPSITILFWFLIYAMGAIGNIIILTSISLCIYLFIFYKGQTVPYILLPDESNERNIRIYTTVAFCFKVVEMIGFIYQYWDVDIFFIDWEQPRTMHNQVIYDSPHTSLRKLYSNRFLDNEHKSLKSPSDIIGAKRKKIKRKSNKNNSSEQPPKFLEADNRETDFSTICSESRGSFQEIYQKDDSQNLPVSIWRTYFVANQWLKLQTKRKISIILQSVGTLLVLQAAQLYSWSLAVPELLKPESIEEQNNFTLYYAVCTSTYIVIYSLQWLISMIFYERYIKNRLQEFVDLCSIANISVFILSFKFYGFYIHGRSVHGFADTDLPTLLNDLKREEDSLCAHRGLVPGTTEQTFILSLTETFRSTYNELLKHKVIETNRFLKMNRSSSMNTNHILETKFKLKQFLSQFVDHCVKDEDYVIKQQHFLEKLCDVLFSSAKNKSVFYIDNNNSFDQILFYGNEWLLATFEITLFAFIIILYEDCVLASTITVLTATLLITISKYNGKRKLSNKSLLDERFLM